MLEPRSLPRFAVPLKATSYFFPLFHHGTSRLMDTTILSRFFLVVAMRHVVILWQLKQLWGFKNCRETFCCWKPNIFINSFVFDKTNCELTGWAVLPKHSPSRMQKEWDKQNIFSSFVVEVGCALRGSNKWNSKDNVLGMDMRSCGFSVRMVWRRLEIFLLLKILFLS